VQARLAFERTRFSPVPFFPNPFTVPASLPHLATPASRPRLCERFKTTIDIRSLSPSPFYLMVDPTSSFYCAFLCFRTPCRCRVPNCLRDGCTSEQLPIFISAFFYGGTTDASQMRSHCVSRRDSCTLSPHTTLTLCTPGDYAFCFFFSLWTFIEWRPLPSIVFPRVPWMFARSLILLDAYQEVMN